MSSVTFFYNHLRSGEHVAFPAHVCLDQSCASTEEPHAAAGGCAIYTNLDVCVATSFPR